MSVTQTEETGVGERETEKRARDEMGGVNGMSGEKKRLLQIPQANLLAELKGNCILNRLK